MPTIKTGPLKGLKRNHYKAIYIDPPWTFTTRSDAGKGRSPEMHYECMSIEDVKALPIGDIAAKDCAVFMWVIDTHIKMGLDVLDAWGFTYKTRAFCWAKLNRNFTTYSPEDQSAAGDRAFFKGQGFWTRANPEDCLLATRGSPKRLSASVRRLITSPVREHSRKPDEIYDRIEELVAGPYAEVFSRSDRRGWDKAGFEVGKFSAQKRAEIEDFV